MPAIVAALGTGYLVAIGSRCTHASRVERPLE
jgi:hypothetical protein